MSFSSCGRPFSAIGCFLKNFLGRTGTARKMINRLEMFSFIYSGKPSEQSLWCSWLINFYERFWLATRLVEAFESRCCVGGGRIESVGLFEFALGTIVQYYDWCCYSFSGSSSWALPWKRRHFSQTLSWRRYQSQRLSREQINNFP